MDAVLVLPARYLVWFPFLLAALFALFVAPGLLASAWLVRHRGMRVLYAVPVAALTGCLVGYVAFWVWFASPVVGRWFSVAVVLLELAAVAGLLATRTGRSFVRHVDVAIPVALVFVIALFYNAAAASCVDGSGIPCVFGGATWDNALPQFFADHVAAGQPRLTVGDWLGSDRPPLQSGVVLAQSQLTRTAPFADVSYQLLGSALQCLWVVALWVLARRMRVPAAGISVVVALCAFSGFFFFNSVYVWPKLVAAAFGLVGVCLLVAEPRRTLHGGLAAAFFAAGLLMHSGIVFTLVPVGVLLLVHPRYRPSLKTTVAAVGVAAALMGPWFAYQNLYDPPGNRLLKWHLAGVINVDGRGVGEAVVDSYSNTPVSELVDARLRNLRMVLGDAGNEKVGVQLIRGGGVPSTGFVAGLRDHEWSSTLLGIGLLNLGWLGMALPAVRRRWSSSGMDRRLVRLTIGVGLTALALWILALFFPDGAVIHQGSYLTMMLLMIGFAAMLSVWSWRALAAVIAVQAGYFGVVWIAAFYTEPGHVVSRKAIAWMLVGLAGLGYGLWRLARRRDQDFSTAEPDPVPVQPAGSEPAAGDRPADLAVTAPST